MIFEGRGNFGLGPFPDLPTFHDFLEQPNWSENRLKPSSHGTDPWRHVLPDDDAIRFVHGDLNPKNILVSPEGTEPPRVMAIVDWHQSGWYPAYWEYCKAKWTVDPTGEWATEALPKFLKAECEVLDA